MKSHLADHLYTENGYLKSSYAWQKEGNFNYTTTQIALDVYARSEIPSLSMLMKADNITNTIHHNIGNPLPQILNPNPIAIKLQLQ